jgi:hypothetical protein
MLVANEMRQIRNGLANRWLWLFLLGAALLFAASYEVKQATVVDIGGAADCPYLGPHEYCINVPPAAPAWFDRETDPSSGVTYRWSKAQSEIYLPGLGNQPYNVTLRWAGSPITTTTPLTVTINAQEFHWALGSDYQEKTFFVPRFGRLNPDVRITIQSPTFKPPNDNRRLGIRLDWVKVAPADYGLRPIVIPSLWVIGALLAALLLIYLITYRATHPLPTSPIGGGVDDAAPAHPQPLAAGGLDDAAPAQPQSRMARGESIQYALIPPAIALLLALALMFGSRLNLTGFAPSLALTLLWAWLLSLAVVLIGRRWPAVGVLAAIFALAFAVRFGGMEQPQFISSDLTFHAHRIDSILQFFQGQQNFFLDGQLPNGTHVPYPNAYYLILAPLEWLLGGTTEAGKLLLRFFSALLDAATVLLLYRLALRFGNIAALAAAFLYAIGPASFQLFSAGNHSNIFAQVMFIAALGFAVEALSTGRQEEGAVFPLPLQRGKAGQGATRAVLPYLLFIVLTMLGHYGMFIAAVVVSGTIGLLWIVAAPLGWRSRIWPLFGAFVAALIISYLLYYIHFNDQIGGQIAGIINRTAPRGNGFSLIALLGDFIKWQGWVILPLGLLGIVLMIRGGRQGRDKSRPYSGAEGDNQVDGARLLVLGWLLACIPLAFSALFDRDTIRYNYLALPALCICGGLAMQWLLRLPALHSLRSRIALVSLIVVLALVNFAAIWGDLIFNQYH